jgi:transposase
MEESLFPSFNYYLDESDPDIVTLRRQDSALVAVFSARGVTREGILEAAKEDYQELIRTHASSLGLVTECVSTVNKVGTENKVGTHLSRKSRHREVPASHKTKKRYVVHLNKQERKQLEELATKGKSSARKIRRAHVLLLVDEQRTDKEIAGVLGAAVTTVERVRKRFVEEGLEAALSEKPRPGAQRKLDAHQEAYLMALACSDPPEGKKRWSMQLLADRLVDVGVVEEISDETIRRMLKKGKSSRDGSNGAPRG